MHIDISMVGSLELATTLRVTKNFAEAIKSCDMTGFFGGSHGCYY